MDKKPIPEMKSRWDRELTPEELARLTADPYSFLMPVEDTKAPEAD